MLPPKERRCRRQRCLVSSLLVVLALVLPAIASPAPPAPVNTASAGEQEQGNHTHDGAERRFRPHAEHPGPSAGSASLEPRGFGPGLARGRPGPVFDVTAFGAVGDGVTRDTAAIRAATAAIARGGRGGVLLFPASKVYLTGVRQFRHHLRTVSPSAHSPIRLAPCSTFRLAPFALLGAHARCSWGG